MRLLVDNMAPFICNIEGIDNIICKKIILYLIDISLHKNKKPFCQVTALFIFNKTINVELNKK